ncbi:MAG TPA: SagB/ThcOx family dehydrogenase [Bacteroidales bacterium]|nr:SagB/ThcOx family dehydrogenase [Bacteroidales bacterium]
MKLVKRSFLMLLPLIIGFGCTQKVQTPEVQNDLTMIENPQLTYVLPSPRVEGSTSVETAINHRRSHRSYMNDALTAEELSQVLWAAYGISKPLQGYPQTRGGLRTAPSAGARYPLEIYALVGNVRGIEPGVYRYDSREHKISRVIERDIKQELAVAALNQEMISEAPACLFYSAVYSRTTDRYGDRGRERYVCMDLGHSAENVYLQAEALHLGTCAIGAFEDEAVRKVMQLPEEEEPLYIMPIGKYYDVSEF